jgi:CheY-like chemotaxis protein
MSAVLVVEDDELLLRAVVRQLTGAFDRVVAAATAEQALEHLEKERFDAVLSDLQLGPGMNGLDLLELIAERSPQTRRVLYTGDFKALPHTCAHVLLRKPTTGESLIAALRGWK